MTTNMTSKRDRATNYSKEDMHTLIAIIKKRADVIENKKTDAVTVRDKQLAWEKVTLEYNATTMIPRSLQQLRLKYEKLKKTTRAKGSAEKNALYGTGGGPFVCPKFEDSDLLEEIRGMIPLSTEGMPGRHAGDKLITPEELDLSMVGTEEFHMDMDSLIGDHDLQVVNGTSMADVSPVVTVAVGTGMVDNGHQDTASCSHTTIAEWKKYTPTTLKQSKHPILKASPSKTSSTTTTSCQNWAGRRRPTMPFKHQAAMSANSTRFSHWADSKKELATIQKDLLVKEAKLDRQNTDELHQLEVEKKKRKLKYCN